jgi:hypothetical protein
MDTTIQTADDYTIVGVTLSQRNLIDLLAQVERAGSGHIQRSHDKVVTTVSAETNAAHYRDRDPSPGGL